MAVVNPLEEVVVVATGDVVPGSMGADLLSGAGHWLKSLQADAVLANLETPLSSRGRPAEKLVAWRSPPSTASVLRDIGVGAVSLANNHALDYGPEAFADGRAALAEAGIVVVGAGDDIGEALRPKEIASGTGTRVAALGISCTLPLGYAATEESPGVGPVRVATRYSFDPIDLQEEPGCQPTYIHTEARAADVELVCRQIEELRRDGWAVIVSVHWGNAFQKRLAQYQRPLARALVDAGCNLVIGHHPHTLHGIERIDHAVICYSLGNFVMDATLVGHADQGLPQGMATEWVMSPEALVVRATFRGSSLRAVTLLPVVLDVRGVPSHARLEQRRRILDEVEALSPQATIVRTTTDAYVDLANESAKT